VQKYLTNIDEDIDTLDNLIESVLKLSKMDLHESPFNNERFDFIFFAEKLIDKFEPSIKQKKIRLKKNFLGNSPLYTDKKAMESILDNLMENAVKYTDKNGSIEVSIKRPDEHTACFSIINTYRKLNQEELSMIFEPFFRTGEHKSQSGSGLGLTIVKKQVQRCNGHILASNTSNGLMFAASFPSDITSH
ncbi:MAG: HAMP domain-containing histidine kinase, partial [Desulfobacteraceae bacterium]|nr:HAMP domain-containing histidine kinase [Desulfobacteraceae bacterium]